MFRLLIAVMLVASIIRIASAEGLYVKIYGGLTDVSFSENYGNNNESKASTSGTDIFYGGAFGGHINEKFSLELAVEEIETDVKLSGMDNGTGKAEATLAFLNGYYHLDETFYIGAGIGGGQIDVKVSGGLTTAEARTLTNRIDGNLPYQAIIGFTIPLTDRWNLDTNLRYLVINKVDITSISTGLRFNF